MHPVKSAGLALLGAALLLAPSPARAGKDPKAVELAEASMKAMGGRENFDAARMLTFRFTVVREGKTLVDRLHRWDRWTGRYRLDTVTREGDPLQVLMNVNDKKGRVWIAGNEVAGDEAASYVDHAYAQYINDMYWLLMPWKWLDDGVNLSYDGAAVRDSTTYDVVGLTFGSGVGLTSNDHYWAFVNPRTHLMERWEFILQKEDGSPGDGPPSVFAWRDWKNVGAGITLATRKVQLETGDKPATSIVFPQVAFSRTVDEAAFEAPPVAR